MPQMMGAPPIAAQAAPQLYQPQPGVPQMPPMPAGQNPMFAGRGGPMGGPQMVMPMGFPQMGAPMGMPPRGPPMQMPPQMQGQMPPVGRGGPPMRPPFMQ